VKKKFLNVLVSVGFVSSTLMLLPQGVYAQNSSFLPDQILDIFGLLGDDGRFTARFITGRVRSGLIIALALLILVSVVYALLAAFKYIQSQGDPGKIEEAQKAIKAIFYGIAAMMIGVVGIVLVFVFFSASRPASELYQTCLSAPNSAGCSTCIESGRVAANACDKCEKYYEGTETDSTGCVEPT
jgi:fumarate reductase subunit D